MGGSLGRQLAKGAGDGVGGGVSGLTLGLEVAVGVVEVEDAGEVEVAGVTFAEAGIPETAFVDASRGVSREDGDNAGRESESGSGFEVDDFGELEGCENKASRFRRCMTWARGELGPQRLQELPFDFLYSWDALFDCRTV